MSKVCFVTCPAGLEKLLQTELDGLGCTHTRARASGVECAADLQSLYRICLWSRIANRVLYPLMAARVGDEKQYYQALFEFDWENHIGANATIAVDFFSARSCITHSRYGAQLTKDAIVDRLREKTGARPSVDRERPDLRINVYLFKNRARVSIDLAGHSLHQRGYRTQGVTAPLRENLAAAILISAGWGKMAARGQPLCDPMCGSGTFLIEAAMIAGDSAPGLLTEHFGFLGWTLHDKTLWSDVHQDALRRREDGCARIPAITGLDADTRACESARQNVNAAGLDEVIDVKQADFFAGRDPLLETPGLIVINPPYGERLDIADGEAQFYTRFGKALKRRAAGSVIALFTATDRAVHRAGLARKKVLRCSNGGIDCELSLADIPTLSIAPTAAPPAAVPGVEQFANRLRKNLRQLKGWAKSAGVSNYRVYDADLPDFSFAVDLYQSDRLLISMQEYKAPAHIDPTVAHQRLQAAALAVVEVTGCATDDLAVKHRTQQRSGEQYQRLQKRDQFHPVEESGCRLLINIHDYLDTGLFIDHRKIRTWFGKHATGKRFLNLYCYTATASVHAIVGGAASSVSVDLSRRYLEWARRNFDLNGIDDARHQLVAGDGQDWVRDYRKAGESPFDIIFLDPPTFSNSARMEGDWDVQRDHESMIDDCMAILGKDGVLVFSTNFRRFRLAATLAERYRVQDRSQWSLQRDFSRNRRIHQCWFLSHPSSSSPKT
jgi:23S rRNA (guanine2445-N2)-methyltransferase / 23S rRNA (guanine2069-N7)-methyltransferase